MSELKPLEDYQFRQVRPVDLGPTPAVRWEDSDEPTKIAYIAGPMRGYDCFNFPAFDAAAAHLRAQGWAVVNPAEHDREGGFDETKNTLDGFDLQAAMEWDLEQIRDVDAVFLLPGWEESSGACGEVARAISLGKAVHVYSGPTAKKVSTDEIRVTDPRTGGQKGSKLSQVGAVDPAALLEVGKVAGFGTLKYDRYNFLRGYRWSLSFDALQRHLLAFWGGEDLDPETGLSHAAHAAWHCLALVSFMQRGLGTDDRPSHLICDAGMGAL